MSKVIHRKKLFGGRKTAEQVHSENAFPKDAVCTGCRAKKGLMTRIISLAPLDEVRKRDPEFDLMCNLRPAMVMEIMIATKHGPYVRMATAYACKKCTPAAEKAAAKGPSWMIIDIHRGVGPDKIITSG
jgi:hypothetical protein